jgi:hypothetical protein
MNLGEAVITKSHHNWNKIFGNKMITPRCRPIASRGDLFHRKVMFLTSFG